MKTKILAVLMAIITMLTFAACSDSNTDSNLSTPQQKLVGTWRIYTGVEEEDNLTYTFTEDGQVISAMDDESYTADYTVDENYITITYQGTESQNQYEYQEDGALLMMTPVGVALTFYKE